MSEVESLTIEILKQIRDGVAQTNARLDATREALSDRLDQTNARLDQTNDRLDQTNARLDQTNARLDQHERALVRLIDEVVVQGQAIGRLIHEAETLNARFESFLTGAHREDHAELRARLTKLEDTVYGRAG